jgi:nitroreductase
MNHLETIEAVAQARRTIKVFADTNLPTSDVETSLVDRIIAAAGWAPFHKACHPSQRSGDLKGIEPWRFYVLDADQCRRLRDITASMDGAGKIPTMLGAAVSLIVVTWLPNPSSVAISSTDAESFEPTLANVEHIAAASAATQTLLLAATAAGLNSYWSSGGVLREATIFEHLGISTSERFLGAVFLFPSDAESRSDVTTAVSKQRNDRGSPQAWSRKVELGD